MESPLMLSALKKFLSDLFTGPDGETIAIGRVYSLPILVTGLAVLINASWGAKPPMQMAELGIGLAGISAAAGGMIYGTNKVDTAPPSGKD